MQAEDAPKFPPKTFAPFLPIDEPALVVGGQAVNLWGEYFAEQTADLAPFVSKDIDLYGGRELVEQIAALARERPTIYGLRPPSSVVGRVRVAVDGADLVFEVLRAVHGIGPKDLVKLNMDVVVPGTTVEVSVPNPAVMLKAKLANLATIDQARRQDEKHVRILWRVLPLFLRELCARLGQDGLTERGVVNLLEYSLEVILNRHGREFLPRLGLRPAEAFAALAEVDLPKVRSFLEVRLPQALATAGSA